MRAASSKTIAVSALIAINWRIEEGYETGKGGSRGFEGSVEGRRLTMYRVGPAGRCPRLSVCSVASRRVMLAAVRRATDLCLSEKSPARRVVTPIGRAEVPNWREKRF